MPNFSQSSLDQLATCDERLQRLFHEVIKDIDCKVLEGHRDEEAQNKAYAEGKSKLRWPHGNHNKLPSTAVDVVPYPVDWSDTESFRRLARIVKLKANLLDINITWGGDWSGLVDMPHYELKD